MNAQLDSGYGDEPYRWLARCCVSRVIVLEVNWFAPESTMRWRANLLHSQRHCWRAAIAVIMRPLRPLSASVTSTESDTAIAFYFGIAHCRC